MKRVLSLMLAAALAVPAVSALAASSASAQGRPEGGEEGCQHGRGGHGRHGHERGGTPAERVERHYQRLDGRLHFTAAQGPQVRRILEAAAAQMAQLHAQPRSPARHEQKIALFRQTSDRIGALLTPTQRSEFDTMRARFVERMQERQERRLREDEARRGI